eukprot:jgi/Hompol1/4102/HPOL_001723-RA
MDRQAEIERKRKLMQSSSSSSSGGNGASSNKYMKRGDMQKLEEARLREAQQAQQAQQAQLEKSRKENEKREQQQQQRSSPEQKQNKETNETKETKETKETSETNQTNETNETEWNDLDSREIDRRLRARRQPIRLFGETAAQRLQRLQRADAAAADERNAGAGGQRNDFRLLLRAADRGLAEKLLRSSADLPSSDHPVSTDPASTDPDPTAATNNTGDSNGHDHDHDHDDDHEHAGISKTSKASKMSLLNDIDTTPISLSLLQRDRDANCNLIIIYIKRVLLEWERSLDARTDDEKRSTHGKNLTATVAQSAEYLKPFFKALKKRTLPEDILARVTEICYNMQLREYQQANDAYVRLSIGNAPWPIGVTMVGIHERSGREKIFSSQIAHALNDETQRKWIQSLKRLMTFAQTKWPPEDLSKLVG